MRTSNTLKLAVAAALALGYGYVQAVPISATLPVTSSVTSTCSFGTGNNLAFGPYVSGQAANVDSATGQVSANCSAGTPYSIAMGNGLNWNLSPFGLNNRALGNGTGGYLAYIMYVNNVGNAQWGDNVNNGAVYSGVGTNVAQLVTVAGRINGGQTAPAGNYTDAVVATLTY